MAQPDPNEFAGADPQVSFWWALLSDRGQRGGIAIAGILLRHAIPLAGVLLLHWSAQKFLLLAVINFAWNWSLLGVWNVSTSSLVKSRRENVHADAGTWIRMVLVGAVVFCVVTAGLGFPIYYLSPARPTFDLAWWLGLAMTLLAPLPNLVESIRESAAADLSDERIDLLAKQRQRLLFVGIAAIIGAYGVLVNFRYPLVVDAVAVVYVLFTALCELRPDLAAEFAKELPS